MSDKRYLTATATLVLICIAAAAVLRGLVSPTREETCPNFELLQDPSLLGLQTAGVSVNGFRNQASLDGLLVSPPLADLAFTIRRTYGLPAWLFRPTTAIPGPKEPAHTEPRVITVDGRQIPVRFAYAMHRIRQRFAAFTFAYDGEPTLSPFWTRVLESPIAVVTGPRPITYIGVAGEEDPLDMPEMEERAIEFLTSAWRVYESVCHP